MEGLSDVVLHQFFSSLFIDFILWFSKPSGPPSEALLVAILDLQNKLDDKALGRIFVILWILFQN